MSARRHESMARHPEAPGGHCETIGTHRAFQPSSHAACMRRRIYWNRTEKSMFQKTRSQGALGESEKKEADVDGLRNLVAEGSIVLYNMETDYSRFDYWLPLRLSISPTVKPIRSITQHKSTQQNG